VFDRVYSAADAAKSWDVVLRPESASTFPKRISAARHALKNFEEDLARLPDAPGAVGDHKVALLELRANQRLLRSAIGAVSDRPEVVAKIPRVVLPEHQDEPRVATAAAVYLRTIDGNFSAPTFCRFVEALQAHEPLTLDELWNIAGFLKFALLESLLNEGRKLLSAPESGPAQSVLVRLKSLRTVGHTDWNFHIEPLILFDATLRQDPAETFGAMDFDSRELYRKRVAFIARHSDYTEAQVAQAAVDLAREGAQHPADEDPRMQRRRVHIGYYLIDKGFPQLAVRAGFHPPLVDRGRTFIRAHADDFYITGIEFISIFVIAAILFPLLTYGATFTSLTIVVLLALLPATQCAVDLVNNTITAIFEPDPLPKLDFSNGIPADCTTLVAVPSLLLNEAQVRGLVTDLEARFLANRDPHLHFLLLTDLPDSVSKPRENDLHQLVDLATQLINDLNAKYTSSEKGYFLFLHRHRIFNVRQGVWMGWERKRGKLLDLNKLLIGENDAFPVKAGHLEALHQVRYILTLDSDTQLPRGAAARLIGTIAHPLHQAIIHPKLRIVVDGYGILQPRIGVSVRSSSRSRLGAIYSGQNGFDIYTRAISDAYQDLYREGSFTGKGIYEVATLHSVLDRRFPRNSLLSHDLIEGAYARAGLATDIELIDDYPSHLSAYNRRKHRWVRGDWQITQWMFSRVPDESGRLGRNPISEISRWKIFDNLRRSLVEPFTFILFVAGWLGLMGGPLYWTIVPLILMVFPTLIQLAFGLGRVFFGVKKSSFGEAFSGFWQSMLITLLNLVFLPQQTLLAFDAIVRSLVRRFITGQRLLEWETAAEAESGTTTRNPVDRYLALMPMVASGVAVLIYFFSPRHQALLIAAPILLLWGFANIVTVWLNKPPREQSQRIDAADEAFLVGHALRIWRYFHQFGEERHNYLIPDNVEEDGLFEAARVSPTNLGLLLNARQAACEFGFLTVPEFVTLTERSFATITGLEKYRGHLYNWYDTHTLKPLTADPFVSSVDSGNLVASLYTLHSGARAMGRQPLLTERLFSGLRAQWQMLLPQNDRRSPLAQLSLPASSASVAAWIAWLPAASAVLSATAASAANHKIDPWWLSETQNRVNAILRLLQDYLPWMLPEYAPLRELPDLALKLEGSMPSINDATAFAEALDASLARAWVMVKDNSPMQVLGEQLRASLAIATQNLRTLSGTLSSLARTAESLAEETEFAFLADPDRQILSIGYDVRGQKLHEACYDMIASEARIATFLAIARNEIPQQSWFKLSRDHAFAFGRFLLLYSNTLVSRTLVASVQVQRAFAHAHNIPWGISESGASRKDDAGHYHYHAFGIPQIALWIEASAGPVVSPYSTFLALGVDSLGALRNLRRMASAGWVGDYGFYEAVDYVSSPGKAVPVREWMAHHQGMSLLAILNLLHDNIVQRWFHANPLVQSTELLLHEMPVSNSVLRAELKKFGSIRTGPASAGS
jgi:hypothetical protein